MQLPSTTTVLVVGGGPVGLTASILLRRHGIDHVVVERRLEPQVAPAAHVVNARTFEILRAAGVDMERIWARCRPPADSGVRWVTTLTGEELGTAPFEGQHHLDELFDVTPTPLRNLSQHHLEPILLDHCDSVLHGVEWVSGETDDDGVTSTLRDADGTEHAIRSSYVLAADGASSAVRRWVGVTMEGPQRLQSFLTIHVEADLRGVVGDRPATLFFVCEPGLGGCFVAHDIDRTWVYMHTWDPDHESLDSYTPERALEIFRRAAGAQLEGLTLRSLTPWNMSCQVASSYRVGRVFLAGDAAHRFPPTGGLGLNTGVADAQAAVWRIAAVERGEAGPALLDGYDAERRPVAKANADQSLRNAMNLFEVPAALGVDGDLEVWRRRFAEVLSSEDGRARLAVAVEHQQEHFDMLGLQLGFTHEAGAVPDGSAAIAVDEPVRDYVPNGRPGARLPHAWLDEDRARSTLDLVPPDRFVLLTASATWAAAGEALAGSAPLDVVLLGRDAQAPGEWLATVGIGVEGALLVRPDQHVGWRSATSSVEGEQVLGRALDHLLARAAA